MFAQMIFASCFAPKIIELTAVESVEVAETSHPGELERNSNELRTLGNCEFLCLITSLTPVALPPTILDSSLRSPHPSHSPRSGDEEERQEREFYN